MQRLLARDDASPAAIGAMFQRLLKEERVVMPITHALANRFSDHAKVREALVAAIDHPENQQSVRMTIIMLYADRFGEKDLALQALARVALEFNSVSTPWLPFKSDMRTDPRFKAIVRQLGLPEYWRSSDHWSDFCKPVGTDDFECH
jgi:hypothetical protein